ncbi:hypothetical protein [Sphingomonas sp. BK235]|nr:hypothetical protein [Sphingomonas sp. BK235]
MAKTSSGVDTALLKLEAQRRARAPAERGIAAAPARLTRVESPA